MAGTPTGGFEVTKFVAELKCTLRFCRESFKIKVDEKYSGKSMRIECPRCCGSIIIRIPEVPKPADLNSAGDADILGDLFKTGEQFITGTHEAAKDLLGKLMRRTGAD